MTTDPDALELVRRAQSIFEHCAVTDGTCCCGDSMEIHASGMECGHSPVDRGAYAVDCWIKDAAALTATTPAEARREVARELRERATLLGTYGGRAAKSDISLMRRAADMLEK